MCAYIAGVEDSIIGGCDVVMQKPNTCWVLDTMDCVVEKYTAEDCLKMLKKIDLRGFSTFGGMLTVESCEFSSILNHRVRIDTDTLVIDDSKYFNLTMGTHFVTLDDMKGRRVFGFTVKYDIYDVSLCFVWAEKIGSAGIRIVLEVGIRTTRRKYRHYVMMFLDSEMNLMVEKKESYKTETDAEFYIGDCYTTPTNLLAKLSLLKVVR